MREELAELAQELLHHVQAQKELGAQGFEPSNWRGLDSPAPVSQPGVGVGGQRSFQSNPESTPASRARPGAPERIRSSEREPNPAPPARKQTPPAAVPTTLAGRQKALEALGEQAASCKNCRLHKTRRQVVFGEGPLDAKLVFIGEAPGAEEDRTGRPFVGPAGQLLDQILEAMGLRRQQVYIANILKCRPPGNRNPNPDEISQCEPYLLEQLDLLQPSIICALGTFAAQTLLQTKQTIGRLRGRFFQYHGIELMASYHPAYLLRTPSAKRKVWEDMQKVQAQLGIPPGSYKGKPPFFQD